MDKNDAKHEGVMLAEVKDDLSLDAVNSRTSEGNGVSTALEKPFVLDAQKTSHSSSSAVCESETRNAEPLIFPPAPERPLDSDCCGGGCVPCVLDIYEQELQLWQDECARIMRGEGQDSSQTDVDEEMFLCPTVYKKYSIISINHEATDIIRIKLQLPPRQSLGLSLGQHIVIRFKEGSTSTTRQYTPISPLTSNGFFELLIKIYPDGRASQVVKNWKVGDSIEIRGPAGNLDYQPNKYDKVLMLCAGTGVAPMFQVTHSILENEKDDTQLRLIYAARDYSCLMGKEEISEWRRFWNFSCIFLLSQEPEPPPWPYKHGEKVWCGRLTEEIIREELSSSQLNKVLVLVCGTRSFDTYVLSCLKDIGISEANIHRF